MLKEKCTVKLILLNSIGEQITVLENGEKEKGYHRVRLDAAGLSSGVYFYTLHAGNFVQTKKLNLLR